jgi:hypothetical protein
MDKNGPREPIALADATFAEKTPVTRDIDAASSAK